jgi:hypothetical protein
MSDKNPWNPSKKATARVRSLLPAPTECNCCDDWETGEPTKDCIEIVENKEIYGKNYGEWPWAYRCDNCGAYVGMHPFTAVPLGTLADGPMRQARKVCKAPFEALHSSGRMSREDAYSLLAKKLGIPKSECHFAWFNIDQCQKAAAAAREIFLGI